MTGSDLKHYRVEELLGRGGMGAVYRGRDTRLNRPVALKILEKRLTEDDERRRRFLREAQAAAAVTHPAIAQVYDVDQVDGTTFIAMELVEGKTVRRLVADRELDLLGSIDVAAQVAEGLARAHDAGIVHRDIKSDNVMVTPDGHAKLLDFGVAKLVEAPTDPGSDVADMPTQGVSQMQTQAGMVLGTIAYMSPEQARGRAVDHRSDIFSLGVMLYEMATGQMPFGGTSPLDTMHAIAFEESRPVTEIRPGLPPELQRIVGKCLRKRPEDRYQGARALAEDLRALKADTESGRVRALPVSARIQDGLARLRGGGWVTLLFAVGLGALVISLLATQQFTSGSLIFVALVGLLLWRRVRNRRQKLVAKFVEKARKVPEVRLIRIEQNAVTVFVDRVNAQLYPRIHRLVDEVNRGLYFGDPLSLAIRDDAPAAEVRTLLRQSGVVYIREDAFAEAEAG